MNKINIESFFTSLPAYNIYSASRLRPFIQVNTQKVQPINEIRNRIYSINAYFNSLQVYLSNYSYKQLSNDSIYSDLIQKFKEDIKLPNWLDKSDVAFIFEGNRDFTRIMYNFGKSLFLHLGNLINEYPNDGLKWFREAWDKTRCDWICGGGLGELYHIETKHPDFYSIAKKATEIEGDAKSPQNQQGQTNHIDTVSEAEINIQVKATDYQLLIYKNATRKFKKLGLDSNKLTVGSSMLLNAGASDRDLNLWTETFTYLESKRLESGYYTGAFIELIQTPGITAKELKLFACSAIPLIENERPIDELTNDMIKLLERDDIAKKTQGLWIKDCCSQASTQAGGQYETRRDRIKKNVILIIGSTIVKIPFLILRLIA